MIYPFAFTCKRDWPLFEQLVESWGRIRPEFFSAYYDPDEELQDGAVSFIRRHGVRMERQDRSGYGQWSWDSAMCKLAGWRNMATALDLRDEDHVLHVDSDTLFHNDEILHHLTGDFMGRLHSPMVHSPLLGREWSWTAGSFQAAKAWAARKVAALTPEEVDACKIEMAGVGLTFIDDVVVSFLMAKVGAKEQDLSPFLFEVDPEAALIHRFYSPRSFSHLNGTWQNFLGSTVAGKHEIPGAVRKWKETRALGTIREEKNGL